MALIAPLRGIFYNSKLIKNLSEVVSPPYDVIDSSRQEVYYRRHPYNIIRLDFGKTFPGDTPENNRYTRAARDLADWEKEGVLIRDPQPAIYPYRIQFTVPGSGLRVRNGFIALLGLEPLASGKVLPHEKTFSSPKEDRYQLFSHCRMQFCPIFSVYLDPAGTIIQSLYRDLPADPSLDFVDEEGVRHQLWRVTDPAVLQDVRDRFQEKTVYIADGHHRYETSLTYQSEMRRRHPRSGDSAPFDFTLMFFCPMEDPGLVVFPVHRLLNHALPDHPLGWQQRMKDFFTVERLPFTPESKSETLAGLLQMLQEKGRKGAAFALYLSRTSAFFLLTLKENALQGEWTKGLSPLYRELDVVVLSRLVLPSLLGVPAEDLEEKQTITYCHEARQAVEWVDNGPDRLAFLLNPTPVEQVRRIAEAALVMPRKSTYFYPKTLTGLVMHSLKPDETVSS